MLTMCYYELDISNLLKHFSLLLNAVFANAKIILTMNLKLQIPKNRK